MRASTLLLLLGWASPVAAQMAPGDLLLNSFSDPYALVHYRPDGTVVQVSGTVTGDLWEGAAILPNGNWVTVHRFPDNGVNIFDGVTGVEIAAWNMPGMSAVSGDLDVFSDGTLAIVDQGGMVWRYDTTGNLIASWSVSGHPFGILVDDQDHVWTCDVSLGVIWHTDDQGKKLAEFYTQRVGDVAMASDGTLFASRYDTGEVAHYSQGGTFLGVFLGTGAAQSAAIAMGEDETIWVTGQFENLMLNFDLTGTLLGSFDVGLATKPLFLTILHTGGEDIGTNYCGPANFNSTGQSAVISAFGRTEVSKNLVALTASQLPPDVFGYFLNSDVQSFTAFPPGSKGNLCLGGSIGRHVKQVGNSGSAGELLVDLDLAALPRPGGTHSVVAGETWNFQCWFRDYNGGPTSNFTDGIEIGFQ